jgi:hypothetical protein
VANINNPFGLRPLMRGQSGAAVMTEQFSKAAAYGQAIFRWDPVTELAGVLNGPASGITPGTTRYLGVSLNWSPASTLANHQVIVDPNALFVVQGDGTGGITAAIMGYNGNLNVASVAGGGVTRDNSGVQLVESTIAVTSTFDVRILQLYNAVDNALGANARLEIKFNKHLRNAEVTAT